jgi:hypothetical protein
MPRLISFAMAEATEDASWSWRRAICAATSMRPTTPTATISKKSRAPPKPGTRSWSRSLHRQDHNYPPRL